MSTSPGELERRAVQEREHLHEMASELKAKMVEARENLKITTNVRRHFGFSSALVSSVGLLVGYLFAGAFTRR